ncbi:hypothetical protein CJD36_018145 [Flavipsychrobacter stenotrophus]|uniref:Chromosome segregation protein SMC n=1 Tax=Flavipsychrobacter stenotrophus TaxID=2077091 RepID=A0A2S7STK9_9BACT|nr:hypothetical protein [Flavipsychrobacter stenotrophus]PQJ09846.1 hypothetical protein CJD36_018145 [Flavipsychrobacter stenotrophus]
MSQFNQAGAPEESNKNKPIIYWVIIAVLLVACIFLFVSKNKMSEENDLNSKRMQGQLDSVRTDRASLQSDFDAASAKIDQLVSQNAKLDSNMQKDKEEMLAMQQKIKSLLGNSKANASELKKARAMINQLNDKTAQYEARIAELEKENGVLTNKNVVLTKERDSTVTQNIAIKKIGSVLHASNIRMEPIHKKKNGKEKETSKAKKVDVLRVKFDIDENRIAESGTKQLFLRIVGPDGTILSTTTNGSGKMTTSKGDQISFSIMKEISLIKEQPVKDVVVDWNQEGDFARGNYMIEIYSEGYKVGSGNVTLK